MNSEKIDFVITWVDGNDEEWQKEKDQYSPNTDDNSASSNRFRDWGILKYWFRGVEKYAPWVNHIYFVTCGHVPQWLDLNNPKISLIKHSDYIPKDILPTFNANTIELYMHKIPGLSEQFVSFNDDMVIISETNSTDFFVNGLPCESGLLGVLSSNDLDDVFPHILINNNAIINSHFNKKDVIRSNFFKFYNPIYGKHVIRNLLLIPFSYFSSFYDLHLPKSFLKRHFEELWNEEPDKMKKSSRSRFRSKEDVNIYLIKEWYLCKGAFYPRKPNFGQKFELGEDENVYDYIIGHKGKVVCLNDSSEDIDFASIQTKLIDAFDRILPEKSSFEK
jgi:hypothetical protein